MGLTPPPKRPCSPTDHARVGASSATSASASSSASALGVRVRLGGMGVHVWNKCAEAAAAKARKKQRS